MTGLSAVSLGIGAWPKSGQWKRSAHTFNRGVPYWEMLDWDETKVVDIVSLPRDAPDKPYKAKRGSAWVTKVRMGDHDSRCNTMDTSMPAVWGCVTRSSPECALTTAPSLT